MSNLLPVTLESIIHHFSYFLTEMTKLSPHIGSDTSSDTFLDYYQSLSTDTLLNGIFIKNTESDILLTKLKHCIDVLESQNSPYTVWLPKSVLTEKVGTFLENQQLRNSGLLTCIGANLEEINQIPRMEKLTIVSVETQEQYDLYMDILAAGFHFNENIKRDFKAMLSSYGQHSGKFQHYIGYLDNNPVSVISTVSHNNALGMYCGTTLPQYEKMGICTELYRYTMDEGKKSHNTHCVYQSANTAIVNYVSKKFGFKEYGQLLRFVKN